MGAKTPFSIYQYASSTEYLVDTYTYLHSQDATYSYERISEICGFRSRSYTRNILKGIHPATDSDLRALAKAFELSPDEKNYLVLLSAFQNSGGNEVARTLFEKLIQCQKRFAPDVRPFREAEVATSVLHMTLLSVCDLPDSPNDSESIARLLKNRYAPSAIQDALTDLVSLGYLKMSSADGKLVSAGKHWKKYDFNANYFLRQFHVECLDLAKKSLEHETPDQRYLVGSSFVIHEKVFPRIVQKLNSFIENLMNLEGVAGPADTVVQLNVQFMKMGSNSNSTISKPESGLGMQPPTERALDSKTNQSLLDAPASSDLNLQETHL